MRWTRTVWLAALALIAGSLLRVSDPAAADPLGQPGGRDTSFAQIGTGLNDDVNANSLALQPDGKILVGGSFTAYNGAAANYLIRLNADGSRDASFIQTGSGLGDPVYSLALQPDGKLLVGGGFVSYNGAAAKYLIRLNADGSRDASFALAGSGFNSTVESLVVHPDGKILAGGSFTTYNGASAPGLIRLNADGSRDTSFVQTGSGLNASVKSLMLQPDGKILAGGSFTTYNGASALRLIRLKADGSRDTSFVLTGSGFNNSVKSMALQPDGKILVAGDFSSYDVVAGRLFRLNADGTRDASFALAGGFNGPPRALALQLDGKLLVGGFFSSYNSGLAQNLIRFNTDGSRDASFVQTGGGISGSVESLAVQPDGRILAGGLFTKYNGGSAPYLVRLFGVPQPEVTADPAAFGNQPVGSVSPAQTVTVTNTGLAPLQFGPSSVSVAGPDSGQFRVVGDDCSSESVAPAGSCALSVAFAPTSVGAKSARLVVVSNAPSSPTRVALSGTGDPAPPPSPTPTPTVTVTASPSPVPPGKPSDLSVAATTKQVSADWSATAATGFAVKVRGADAKKRPVVKNAKTSSASATVRVSLKKKSKVTVCVRAENSAGTSAQTCAKAKVK